MPSKVLLTLTLALAGAPPLVAPAPEQTAPPREEAQPHSPDAGPGTQAPSGAPAAGAQAPQSTGIPLVDRLLNALGGAQELDVSQWPVLKPDEPRPVIGFKFEYGDFLNATYFKEETLRTFVQHPPGKPRDPALLDDDAQFIALQYRLRGFTRSKVNWTVEETDRGDIITFNIEAGSRAQLKSIDVVGNLKITDEKLLEGLFHRPLNIWSLTDRGGVYHAGYIDQDLRTITKNYADHGFLAAKVKGSRIYSPTSEGDALHLAFDVEDGPLFHLGAIILTGDVPGSMNAAMQVLGMRPGDAAELRKLDAGVERLLDMWRNRGYAGARAVQERRIREERRLLDVLIRVEKGAFTRVGKVRIVGDPTTADHVITRDVVVRENDIYSLRALKLSEERLMYTGLFQKVTLRPVPTDDPAVVDIEVEVVEQQTWYFSVAPSYIPGEGLVGIGLIGFRNLFGQAWRFNGQGVISRRRQTGRIDVEDPRVFDTRLSVGGNLHRDRYVYPEFVLTRTGGGATLGYPLVEHSLMSLGYSLERIDMEMAGPIERYANTPRFPYHLVGERPLWWPQKRRGAIRLDLAYDRRDNILFPSRGVLFAGSVEYGGPMFLGQMEFMTLALNARFYVPLPYGFVIKNNTAGAYTFVPGGGVVPASERFYEGGAIQSIRGFAWQSISPTVMLGDPLDPGGAQLGARIGGVSRFVNNLELESPALPIAPVVPVKLFVFFDAGNTWSEQERPFFFPNVLLPSRDGEQLPFGLFYSVGVGAMLATALFPLRIEFTLPLTRRSFDDQINFFISAGSPF